MVTAIVIIGLAISCPLLYWYWTHPAKVCVATERQLVPIYAENPNHYTKGTLTGYVDKQVCVKWELEPVEPKKPFVWPNPVY
jgi:hypothetical protein